jgi:hypothetical protein
MLVVAYFDPRLTSATKVAFLKAVIAALKRCAAQKLEEGSIF